MNIELVNTYRIGFVYAALGLISSNVRCAAFSVKDPQHFEALFILRQDSELDRAAIKLICEEFEAQHPDSYTKSEGRFHIECRIEIRESPIVLPLSGGLTPFFREFNGNHLIDDQEEDPPAWWVDERKQSPG